MRRHLERADCLFMDETTAPVLDPGRGQTKKGYFWAIVSDDRGHSGPSPPIVLFRYAPGRSGAFAEQFLHGFNGRFLQCDAYDGYDRLTEVARPQGPQITRRSSDNRTPSATWGDLHAYGVRTAGLSTTRR